MRSLIATRCLRRFPLALPLGLVLAAPLAAQNSDAPFSRTCSQLDQPKILPAVDQLVDSAAVISALTRLQTGGFHGDAIFSLVFRRSELDSIHILQTTLNAPASDSVPPMLHAAMRRAARLEAPSIRLHVTVDTAPRLTLERSELCSPGPVPGEGATTVGVRFSVPSGSPSPYPGIAEFRLRITPDGRVASATITSSSGVPEMDAASVRAIRHNRFMPALLDGRPVEVWLERGRTELVKQ